MPRTRARSTPSRLGEVAFDDVVFRYPDAPRRHARHPQGRHLRDRARAVRRVRRAVGRRQDDGVVPGAAAARRDERARAVRRRPTCASCRRSRSIGAIGIVSQETYLFHATIAENLRYAKPDADRRRARDAAARGEHPRHDRVVPRRLRHGRGRARLPALGRREAAHRDRARAAQGPAGAHPRRGHQRARHRDRAHRAGGPRCRGARAARRSRSRTGSRPCATPT